MDACYGIYMASILVFGLRRSFYTTVHWNPPSVTIAGRARHAFKTTTKSHFYFLLPLLLRRRLLYEIGIVLQIPLLVMGPKRFHQLHGQTEGSLGASECVWTFSHSIDQTSILRPKGRLDRLVNED
jgi:hypothetical protein